jgi:hypothetical protein
VTALVLGWAALRIVWTEVLQSRREHSVDRAATADAYRSLFSERAAEHAEFTTAMTERLSESTMSVHELRAELVQSQAKVAEVALRADSAESSYASTLVRVAELQRSIDLLRAEGETGPLGELDLGEPEAERGSIEELMSFDEKVALAAGKHTRPDAKLA